MIRTSRLCAAVRCAVPFLLAASALTARADSFKITALAPGIQTPSGVTSNYETFSTLHIAQGNLTTNFAGSNVTGTFTGGYSTMSADMYGGAGGAGNYLAIVGVNSATLTLSQPQTYLGLWFSALDQGNEMQFYKGNTLVETFLPSDYAALVGACSPATSPRNDCGNPNSAFMGQDPGEQFAYLNFYDLTGTFNRIVFTEHFANAAFEFDNVAVAPAPTAKTLAVRSAFVVATPEPSSLALLGTGFAALATFVRRSSTNRNTLL